MRTPIITLYTLCKLVVKSLLEEIVILVTDSIVLVSCAYCNPHNQEGSNCRRISLRENKSVAIVPLQEACFLLLYLRALTPS